MTLCYIAWCLLVFYSLFSCLSCSLTFLDFSFFDLFVWYLQYWIAALVFFAIIGSLPWCTVSSYPACHVYVKYSSSESFFFFFPVSLQLLQCEIAPCLWLAMVGSLWLNFPLNFFPFPLFKHLSCTQQPALLCRSTVLSWKCLVECFTTTQVIDNRGRKWRVSSSQLDGILHLRLKQNKICLCYVAHSNCLLTFWENDLMVRAVFY